jgi:hypothetical protein
MSKTWTTMIQHRKNQTEVWNGSPREQNNEKSREPKDRNIKQIGSDATKRSQSGSQTKPRKTLGLKEQWGMLYQKRNKDKDRTSKMLNDGEIIGQ